MNCPKCSSLAREIEDEYEGQKYVLMLWCDECDKEVNLDESVRTLADIINEEGGDRKMKATKTIVIARVDSTPKLVIVTDDKKGEFLENTAMETFIKAYAGIYKAICMELYADQKFLCSYCDLHLYFTRFSGIVMGGEGSPDYLCLKCAGNFGSSQGVKEEKKPMLTLVKGSKDNVKGKK